MAMGSQLPSTWKATSPPGSLTSIIRMHPHLRLFVDPLFWTQHHPQLLKVSVVLNTSPNPNPTPTHRSTCPRCHSCGKVPLNTLNLLRYHPYPSELDQNLARVVRSSIVSLKTPSGTTLFKTIKQHYLPLSFSGRRQCWVLQPLFVQEMSSGMPLLAFTHESGRSDAFDNLFSRCASTKQAKARLVGMTPVSSHIIPHDVAVLIAMAQEARRVQAPLALEGQGDVVFTPSLITPTPDRDALYVYRASIPIAYLDSFVDVHKPLETDINITRTTVRVDNTTTLLEHLGHTLDLHQRLEMTTSPYVPESKENSTQKRGIDDSDSHPIKRQRYSKMALAEITALNGA